MSWKQQVQELKLQLAILYQAMRDPRLPWHIRLWPWIVVAYALSPIDLIPDFIPILGYLDDLLLIPLGIILALKLIPAAYQDEYRQQANDNPLPTSKAGLAIILTIWLLAILWAVKYILL